MKKRKINKIKIYKQIIDLLNKLQLIQQKITILIIKYIQFQNILLKFLKMKLAIFRVVYQNKLKKYEKKFESLTIKLSKI